MIMAGDGDDDYYCDESGEYDDDNNIIMMMMNYNPLNWNPLLSQGNNHFFMVD